MNELISIEDIMNIQSGMKLALYLMGVAIVSLSSALVYIFKGSQSKDKDILNLSNAIAGSQMSDAVFFKDLTKALELILIDDKENASKIKDMIKDLKQDLLELSRSNKEFWIVKVESLERLIDKNGK